MRSVLVLLLACRCSAVLWCPCVKNGATTDNPPECANVDCSKCGYNEYSCPGASRVMDGVYEIRINACCAVGSWAAFSFADTPDTVSTSDGHSYFKSGNTLVEFKPSPSPTTVDYPGHPSSGYNNLTCSNRCCRLQAFGSGDMSQPCGSSNNCVGWGPCGTFRRFTDSMGIVSAILPVFCVVFVVVIICQRPLSIIPFVTVLVTVLVQAILFIVVLVPVSEYDFWYSSTEVSMEYMSYQACMGFCDTKSDDSHTIIYKFCGDAEHAKYPWSYPSVNQFLPKDSTCPYDLYCNSCYDHVNDWHVFRDAVDFLRYRTIVLEVIFVAGLVIVIMFRGVPVYEWYVINAACVAYYVGLFISCILGCVMTAQLVRSAVIVNEMQSFLNAGQSVPIPVKNVCIVTFVFDFILLAVGLVSWCCCPIEDREDDYRYMHQRYKSSIFTADDRRSLITFSARMPVNGRCQRNA